ncbi:MAG: protein kinase [Anaerolineaceae bacterium]|nr:protein kinase [Anaerolineaceae bacterium]
MMATIGPSWIGRTLGGRYEIESILGRGGMSSVYRANDRNLRRKVAVKIIHQHLSENKEFIERFEQEATVIAQLRHTNIVQVHDFNHEGEVYFMVMEYVPGETLAKRLESLKAAGIRLPLAEAVHLLTTICEAVDYAHQRHMIHRDLKPANVMITLLNEPVLMDFGIAKIVGGRSAGATGSSLGTAAYMSPEQVRGEHADHRSDIYSLGIMMYEMLSGSTPYQGDSTYQVMFKQINDPVPDIQTVEANTPSALVHILERALSKNPEQRFQTALEMATALKTAAHQLQSPTDTQTPHPTDPLTDMWQHAQGLFRERDFARCLDRLGELHRADPDFQAQPVQQLRQQAIKQLVQRAEQALNAADYSESLTAVKSLRERDINHDKLDQLEAGARAGLDTLSLQARLNTLYEEALDALDKRDYQAALARWQAIEQRRGTFIFPDRLAVVKRANEGISAHLYGEAIAALAHKNPEQVLARWTQITAIDRNYPDTQDVVAAAQAMIHEQERRGWSKPVLLSLAGLAAVLLVVTFVFNWLNNDGGSATAVTVSPTALAAAVASTTVATAEPSATTTAVLTQTPRPTETAVPSRTSVPTAAATANVTAMPEDMAVATANAALFAQADAEASEIGVVMADEMVSVLARSANNNWLYVQDEEGNAGFVFAELFTWSGNVAELPIRTAPAAGNVTAVTPSSGSFTLDIYPLPGTEVCTASGWTQQIYMRAQGVSGTFAYYWQGELVGTAENDNITFAVTSSGGVVIGTGSVIVDGQTVSADLFVPAPDCAE